MTNLSFQKANSDTANKGATAKAALSADIRSKWGKFSDAEIGALKSDDDLVTQVVAKYSLERSKAQTDVTAVIKGRHI